MPRRARAVAIQAVPASIPREEAVRRVARATNVLRRIAARLDEQARAQSSTPNDRPAADNPRDGKEKAARP